MIKKERICFLREILIAMINHWCFFPLAITCMAVAFTYSDSTMQNTLEKQALLLWGLCQLFSIAYFLIRNYVKHILPFFLLHFLALAGVFLLPVQGKLIYFVICTFAAIVAMLLSFSLKLKQHTIYSSVIPPAVILAVTVASVFIGHQVEGVPDFSQCELFVLTGTFGCYLLVYFLEKYLEFLRMNQSSAGLIPAKEIFQSGFGLVSLYAAAVVLLLLLSTNVSFLESIFRVLKTGAMFLLGLLFRLLSHSSAEETEVIGESMTGRQDNSLMLPEPEESFWLWQVLEYAAMLLVACAGIVFLVWLLVKLFRFLQAAFLKEASVQEKVFDNSDCYEVREKCNKDKHLKKKAFGRETFREYLTPRERIRRLYKKKVLSLAGQEEKKAALAYLTPRETALELSLPQIAPVYEKARYTEEMLTSEDVARMKELLKKEKI